MPLTIKLFPVASVFAMMFVAPAASAQTSKPLSQSCPALTSAQVKAIQNYKGEFGENALYERAYCVPMEEAERRMAIQMRGSIGPRTKPGRPARSREEGIGALAAMLHEKESGTFAGLWIQHQPEYRVMVAFTRDAAKTLAKYTRDPLFKPLDRPGPSLIELRAMQDRLMTEFRARGIGVAMASSRENRGVVEIHLGQEAAPIRAAAARGEFPLPPWVVLIEPNPLPFPAPPPPRPGASRVKSFPQVAQRTDMYMRTLVGVPDVPAKLRLSGGCLMVDIGKETRTALWQASDALDLSDPRKVVVVNRLSGVRIAAGEEIVLSGLQPNESEVPKGIKGIEGCPGPYRVVSGYSRREDWDAQRRESGIAARMAGGKTRAAAIARYDQDQARVIRLKAWRERMLADRGDTVAAVWVDEEQGTAHLFHTRGSTLAQLVPVELRSSVTAQEVPVGYNVLEGAKVSLQQQLASAGVEASVQVEPLQGIVEVRPKDGRALSAAAVAGRIRLPEVSRVALDAASSVTDEELIKRRDPEEIWYRLETAPDFAAIRKLVEATPLPVVAPTPPARPRVRQESGKPKVTFARQTGAASLSTARFLVAYGQSAREIVALKAAGFDPVDALDAMNGRSTDLTRAIFARQVVVAEFVSLAADRGQDGYRSTAQWRVVETLKGDARAGDLLRVRMVSGEEPGNRIGQSGEEPLVLPGLPGSLEPGGRWLLHLNDGLYSHAAFINGGEGAARNGRWYVTTMTPASIIGDQVRATFFDQKSFSLGDLRKKLAPLYAAMAASGLNGASKR